MANTSAASRQAEREALHNDIRDTSRLLETTFARLQALIRRSVEQGSR